MKRLGLFSKLLPLRAGNSVAKVKSDAVTLPDWEPLLRAVMHRVEKLEETELFMIHFKSPRSKLTYGEYPTLVIGRLKPILNQSSGQSEIFISAMGKVADGIEPGSEDLNWLRLGFQSEASKRTKSFGTGPVPVSALPQILVSAFDLFSIFYGASSESRVGTIGDPELEEILDNSAGLKRIKLGEYHLT
jgi:hypothetical protein